MKKSAKSICVILSVALFLCMSIASVGASPTEYSINTVNCTATKDGAEIARASVGTEFTVEADRAPDDFVFDHWLVTYNGNTFTVEDTSPMTATMQEGDVTFEAVYVEEFIIPTHNAYFTLSSFVTLEGGGSFTHGSEFICKIIPYEGCEITEIKISVEGTELSEEQGHFSYDKSTDTLTVSEHNTVGDLNICVTSIPYNGIFGDANRDYLVNIKDATAIQKHAAEIVKLDDYSIYRVDVNFDGEINVRDATLIQKWTAGIDIGTSLGYPMLG